MARRDHGSEELRRKLLDKGYDSAIVGRLIERLFADKLLDDRRFLENFVAYRAARGQGPERVRADLRKLAMHGEAVEASIDAYPDWVTQLRRARERSLALRCRAITLIDSARLDFSATGVSPVRKFAWLWALIPTLMQTK